MPRIRIDSSSRQPIDYDPEDEALVDASLENGPPPDRETTGYVELTVRTNFSFLQGASPPEELVAHAASLGYDAIGITDRDGLYGMVRALEEADRRQIRLVVGCELTVGPGFGAPWISVTVHVVDHTGYTNLCLILTESHRLHPKGKPRKDADGLPKNHFAGVPLPYVCAHAAGLWAMAHDPYDDATVSALKEAFGDRVSLGLVRHKDGLDRARTRRARQASARHGVPICATNGVLFAHREGKPVLDVLHCIREGVTLNEAGRALLPNAEPHLKARDEMAHLFSDMPSALERAREIATACVFSMRDLKYAFPSEFDVLDTTTGERVPTEPREHPDVVLRRRTYEGANRKYDGAVPESVSLQIEKELALISHIQVAPYFLSVEAIVNIARSLDILCQGRGSAANSAVCYCLGITAVDPTRSNLLFERFLSSERREPPDIDVDFEHERREEVIQEIYKRYGRDRAAMVSEVIAYRGKSALREVGKVFGYTLEQVDGLATLVTYWDSLKELPAQRIIDAGFDPEDSRVLSVLACARAIQGFPRHLSIHVGGFVLSATPIYEVAPVEPATMQDRTVIPWDKDDIDTLGFFKVDVLGLGMLTAIRKTLAMVQDDPQLEAATAIDMLDRIPPEDPAVYEALCRADTVGVFQIESRAQMAMLPRLRPIKFYDLVVEVAIVRPGPIQGGMIHPYLRRRSGEEAAVMPHPCLEGILARTLGVPLFQEQVMQIAIVGAGYTGGEADQLRRDMAAWRKTGNLERHRDRLARGFRARGISDEFAERLYKQIQGFGEYGFPESHAASFGLLVYASAWLKVHKPAAFAAALINSQPMGFYSPSTLLQDAQKHGVEVRAVCIERSDWDCTLETSDDGTPAIRIGLRLVRGLGEVSGRRIVQARTQRMFTTIEELSARAQIHRGELQVLAESGALEPIVKGRREALWKVHAPRGEGLFAGLDLGDALPSMPPITRAQQLLLDYERTGLSVSDHPMRLMRPRLPSRIKSAADIAKIPHDTRVSVAGMVICRQRPQTASGVVFITMEDETGFLNLIVFARVFDDNRYVATTSSLLLAHGKIEREGDVIYVVVKGLERLSIPGDEKLPTMSRDFH